MALELYMLGLIVQDMSESLQFYRRLGLAIPEGCEDQTHVQIKMGNGLTFFLDSNPSRFDPGFVRREDPGRMGGADSYHSLLEFYLRTQDAVEAKYAELTDFGYKSHRAPYETPFGMCFAMVNDPDGNTILLSGDLKENGNPEEAS
jgi:uncharacterized glyoxalase superfamily protein PhnB